MQGIANDRPEIAQRIIEKAEKSIGATGFEPATQCSQSTQYAICDSTHKKQVRLQLISWYYQDLVESQYCNLMQQGIAQVCNISLKSRSQATQCPMSTRLKRFNFLQKIIMNLIIHLTCLKRKTNFNLYGTFHIFRVIFLLT